MGLIILPYKIEIHAENFPGSDKSFIVRDNFVERFNPHIAYVGRNVREKLDHLIVPPVGELSIDGYVLSETIFGNELVRGFGRNDGFSFVVAWHLLLKQPNGEESGFLLTNGSTNVFLDCGFSIGLFWFEKGWSIRAYPANSKEPRPWFSGNQVVLIH